MALVLCHGPQLKEQARRQNPAGSFPILNLPLFNVSSCSQKSLLDHCSAMQKPNPSKMSMLVVGLNRSFKHILSFLPAFQKVWKKLPFQHVSLLIIHSKVHWIWCSDLFILSRLNRDLPRFRFGFLNWGSSLWPAATSLLKYVFHLYLTLAILDNMQVT